jgi:predicted DNA-binding transcriptional regulator AlpA
VLIGIGEIRLLFGVGRTSAYELTHRPGFPAPVLISPRCYRWWLDEVTAFADELRNRADDRRRAGAISRAGRTSPSGSTESLRISGRIRPARRRQEPQ